MKLLLICMVVVLHASTVKLIPYVQPNVGQALIKAGIVPTLIYPAPQGFLEVCFEDITANLGNEICPGDMVKKLVFIYSGAVPNCLYTIVLVDMDAPTAANPFLRSVLIGMWVNLATNIQLDPQCQAVSYVPRSPPPGTGLHRYVAIIFSQLFPLDISCLAGFEVNRLGFSVEGFASNNSLTAVGANYFVSQFPKFACGP